MNFVKRIAAPLSALVLMLSLLVCVNAAETGAVTGPNGSYATMKAAVAASVAGDTLQLNQDLTEDVIIRKNLTLDLNGYDLNGTLTVSNGKVVTVKDSSTDDFDSADGYGTVKATAGTGKVKAAEGYLAVTGDTGLSYHRLDLQISSVNLRPGVAGMYFGSNYGGDEAVKAQIKAYGMVMSLAGAPTVQDIVSDTAYTTHTAFSADSWVCGETGKAYGTLLQNIMKPSNTTEQNTENARRYIYSVAYAELKDGTYVLGDPVTINLQEVAEKVDTIWNTLSSSQSTGMKEMFQSYEATMEHWNVPNLLKTDRVQVTFVDFDNSIIDIQTVDIGSSATRPADPVRKNYLFTGWDKSFTNVVTDLTVKAQYIRQYTVTFVDYDGTVLATEVVNRGSAATPPTDPVREGYTFTSWDRSYSNVTSDLQITAVYTINRYTVKFLDADGSVLKTLSNVPHGATVTPPEAEEMYFDWSSGKGYLFVGWKNWNSTQKIVGNTTITTEYSEITQPIIAIETTEISKGTTTATVSVYLWGSFQDISGVSLQLQYDQALTLSSSSVVVNDKLVGAEVHLNTQKRLYELLWIKGNNSMADTRLEVLTLTFSLDRYTSAGEYLVDLLAGSYIIDGNLTKVTPIVITGGVAIAG